ncbi:MAG: hypothetical protein KDM63_15250, partial [Verrucomicrobiae bacterium]|nr:hypothetical protein [Verrucomicrobiae bacterium]
VTGLRIWQEGAVRLEYHGGRWTGGDAAALARMLATTAVDPEAVMDVEVICGPGMPLTSPLPHPTSAAAVTAEAGAARGPGLFFRPGDGSPVDLWGLHRGGTVFLCLNGPSFDEETRLLLEHRPGVVTFCVNNGGHGFRPDLWTCMDAPERFMGSIWRDGRITKFVPAEHLNGPTVRDDGEGPRVSDCPNVWGYWRNDHFHAARFLSEGTVNWGNHKSRGGGRSVMLAALRISWELGFRRVVLVGCDFEMSPRRRYWFPEDRTEQAIRNNRNTYGILRGFFRELVPVFAAAGLEVVNATPGSGLEVFPRVDLLAELRRARLSTAATTQGMYR